MPRPSPRGTWSTYWCRSGCRRSTARRTRRGRDGGRGRGVLWVVGVLRPGGPAAGIVRAACCRAATATAPGESVTRGWRYHFGIVDSVAMTLRLTDDEAAALRKRAEREGR